MIGFRLWWYVHLCWKSCKVCFILHNICPHWTKTVFYFWTICSYMAASKHLFQLYRDDESTRKTHLLLDFDHVHNITTPSVKTLEVPEEKLFILTSKVMKDRSFFRLQCPKCFLAFWMSFKGRLVVFFTALLSISELNPYCQCVNAAQSKLAPRHITFLKICHHWMHHYSANETWPSNNSKVSFILMIIEPFTACKKMYAPFAKLCDWKKMYLNCFWGVVCMGWLP